MQPSKTMMKILAFLSYSVFEGLPILRNREKSLKPSSLPSKQRFVS